MKWNVLVRSGLRNWALPWFSYFCQCHLKQPLLIGVTVVFRPWPTIGLNWVCGCSNPRLLSSEFLPNQIYPIHVNWVLETKSISLYSPLLKFILLIVACDLSMLPFLHHCSYIKTANAGHKPKCQFQHLKLESETWELGPIQTSPGPF
jgi:hypothetical protein